MSTDAAEAARLGISRHTVNKDPEHIYRKLEVIDRRQAVAAAFAERLS